MARVERASPDLITLMLRGQSQSIPGVSGGSTTLTGTDPRDPFASPNQSTTPTVAREGLEEDFDPGPGVDQFISEDGRGTSTTFRTEPARGKVITLSTKARLRNNPQSRLICVVGVRTAGFRFPQRSAEVKVRSGTILYVWPDRKRRTASRKSFYDELAVSLTFQSGNIIPQEQFRTLPSRENEQGRAVVEFHPPLGLQNFYDFLSLFDEPKVLKNGEPNFVVIEYRSNVFPQITLEGFFTPDGINVTEDAENPNQMTWDVTFNTRRTNPPINSPRLLAQMYTALTRGVSTGQDRPVAEGRTLIRSTDQARVLQSDAVPVSGELAH